MRSSREGSQPAGRMRSVQGLATRNIHAAKPIARWSYKAQKSYLQVFTRAMTWIVKQTAARDGATQKESHRGHHLGVAR